MKRLLPILVAVVMSAILTWPLLPNLASYYPDQGDYPLNGDVLWYNFDAITSGKIFNPTEYFKGFQFYPQSYSLLFANNPVAGELVFGPIYLVTHNLPLSVNLYAFLTLVLSFLSAYYVVNYFVKNELASIVGASIFTFNPLTFAHFPQHIDILSRFFLPLVFLFAYKLFDRPSFKTSVIFFVLFTLNALTHTYYPIFTLIFLPLLSIPFLIARLKIKDFKYLLNLVKVSLVGLIFLPILLYFNLPVWQFSQKEGAYRPLESVPFFSARITDWFAATPDNLVWGGFVKSLEPGRTPKDDRGILNYEEHTLFPGLIALILFVVGLKRFRKTKLNHSFFWILLGVPFLLTFGPYFGGESSGLPLPFYWLYKILPLMQGIRSPGRFEFLLDIPLALIASYGVLNLLDRWKKVAVWITVSILLLVTLENFTFKDFSVRSDSLSQINNVGLSNLAFLRGKATLHLPIYSISDADVFGKNSAYLNWATQTGERIFNGNASYLPGDQIGMLEGFKDGLNDQSEAVLKSLGVDYVVVHGDFSSGLKAPIFTQAGVTVFDLSKIKTTTPICQSPDLDIVQTSDTELLVKNKADCYLLSPGDKRYQTNDSWAFRMPLVVEPKGQVVVSEDDKSLRPK